MKVPKKLTRSFFRESDRFPLGRSFPGRSESSPVLRSYKAPGRPNLPLFASFRNARTSLAHALSRLKRSPNAQGKLGTGKGGGGEGKARKGSLLKSKRCAQGV